MPYRSKLIPFEAEIADLRRKRPPTPYSEIVRLLKDRHGLTVQVSTLFNFVKVRRKWDRLQSLAPQPLPSAVARSASTQPMSEIQRDRSTPRAGPPLPGLSSLLLAVAKFHCHTKNQVAEL